MNIFNRAEIIDQNFSKNLNNSTLPDSTIELVLSDVSLGVNDLICPSGIKTFSVGVNSNSYVIFNCIT